MSGIGLEIVNWCLVLGKFVFCDFFHFSVSGFCGFSSLNWFALWANVGVYVGSGFFKLLTIGPSRLVAVMAIRITGDQLR